MLDGDPDDESKGGHRYGTGRRNKHEFPADWNDDRCISELESVVDSPDRVDPPRRYGGNWFAHGTRDGVHLTAVVRPDGTLTAGWPTGGRGVRRNPPRRGR
ncbi:MAG: EndoU domain-containing protein [Micromonosporaceae bacterium]